MYYLRPEPDFWFSILILKFSPSNPTQFFHFPVWPSLLCPVKQTYWTVVRRKRDHFRRKFFISSKILRESSNHFQNVRETSRSHFETLKKFSRLVLEKYFWGWVRPLSTVQYRLLVQSKEERKVTFEVFWNFADNIPPRVFVSEI